MSSSFLSRFQNKISTVTSDGNFRHVDGLEEVREGPKRNHRVAPSSTLTPCSFNDFTMNDSKNSTHSIRSKNQRSPNSSNNENDESHGRGVETGSSCEKTLKDKDPIYASYSEMHRIIQSTTTTNNNNSNNASTSTPHKKKTKPVAMDKNLSVKPPLLPEAINEEKAKATEDHLAFSKKARKVEYQPYTLEQYQESTQDKYFELGKLQPDLNRDDLVAKRANKERVKAFSRSLRTINSQQQQQLLQQQQQQQQQSSLDVPSTRKASDGTKSSAREKALAFAKQVPKPKTMKDVVQKSTTDKSCFGSTLNAASNNSPKSDHSVQVGNVSSHGRSSNQHGEDATGSSSSSGHKKYQSTISGLNHPEKNQSFDGEGNSTSRLSRLEELQRKHRASRSQVETIRKELMHTKL